MNQANNERLSDATVHESVVQPTVKRFGRNVNFTTTPFSYQIVISRRLVTEKQQLPRRRSHTGYCIVGELRPMSIIGEACEMRESIPLESDSVRSECVRVTFETFRVLEQEF